MESGCRDKLLLKELAPWLTEFGKLGVRGEKTLELIRLLENGDYEKFWAGYTGNIMTQEEIESYNAHKCGTLKLQPFYENAMYDLGNMFFSKISGKNPHVMRGIGSFSNSFSTQTNLMFDNDTSTYYTSGAAQEQDSWIGVDLGNPVQIKEISILQGRNSVDDVDYFDHAALQCSVNGRAWTTLIDNMREQYIIRWSGNQVEARFVRLKRLDSKKQNWASVRSFEVNPVRADNLGFTIISDDTDAAVKAFDKDLQSFFRCDGTLSFEVPEGTGTITVLTGDNGRFSVEHVSEDGTGIRTVDCAGPYMTIDLADGTDKVYIKGKADIYEIIL